MIKAALALALAAAAADAATTKLATISTSLGVGCTSAVSAVIPNAQDGVCTYSGVGVGSALLNCTAGTFVSYGASQTCTGVSATTLFACTSGALNATSTSVACASTDVSTVFTLQAYVDAACANLAFAGVFPTSTCALNAVTLSYLKGTISGGNVTVGEYATGQCTTAAATLTLSATSCQPVVLVVGGVNTTSYLRAFPGVSWSTSTPTVPTAPSAGVVAKASAAAVAAVAALAALVF